MTVREHLSLAQRKQGTLAREQLIELLPELEKCLDRKAGVLSGGEQQMLAVGRALVSTRILLVDEMSLGLAPVIVERLLPILRRVAVGHRRRRPVRRAARLDGALRSPTACTCSATGASYSRAMPKTCAGGVTSCAPAISAKPPSRPPDQPERTSRGRDAVKVTKKWAPLVAIAATGARRRVRIERRQLVGDEVQQHPGGRRHA